jgi:hypothetical protein
VEVIAAPVVVATKEATVLQKAAHAHGVDLAGKVDDRSKNLFESV